MIQVSALWLIDYLAMYMIEEFFYAALDVKQIEWAHAFLMLIQK